ncbi:MAG: hypothetical protein LBH03_01580 [Holophagales bacterium]|nr:hypothetical protein [Holophagales bacterium]
MGLLPNSRVCGHCGRGDTPFVILGERGWCCSACTPADKSETLPGGTKEYLNKIRTVRAEETPDSDESNASRAVTQLLRGRLLNEIGNLKSYDILFRIGSPMPGNIHS